MKITNFTFIFALVFFFGNLQFINSQFVPYPDYDPFDEGEQNYMIVYYGKEVQLDSNFFHEHRTNIKEIKTREKFFTKDSIENITVTPKDKLKIYFNSSLSSLESFFDRLFDDNVKYITSVDLTNFDATSVTSTKNMFYECVSLKSVTFSEFSSELSDTQSMFDLCESLEAIDLSQFDMSSVTNTMNMFFDCRSLKKLVIPYANLGQVENAADMFFDLQALEYISLKKATIAEKVKEEIEKDLSTKDFLMACQSEEFFQNKKFKYICCDYDIQSHTCKKSNYIIVYYGEKTDYENGFNNTNREEIGFIIYNDSLYDKYTKLTIEKNLPIEIHFDEISKYFNGFFGIEADKNVQKIVSIDFSCFETYLITSLQKTFSGCSNLKSIDLSVFNHAKLLDTSNMLEGCSSLIEVDISGFNMSEIQSPDNVDGMFSDVTSLKYLNIKGINLGTSPFGDLSTLALTVCQDSSFVTGSNIKSDCCYFYKGACEGEPYENYVIVYYKKETKYTNFFTEGSNRNDVYFIMNGEDEVYDPEEEEFTIASHTPTKIYFSKALETMENFFRQESGEKFDSNAQFIESVDFSHLDGSSITSFGSLFYGCKSLKSVNLNIFKTPSLKDLKQMFYGCSKIEEINLSNLNLTQILSYASIFSGCTSLKIVDLSNINFLNCEDDTCYGDMFKDLTQSLKYISIKGAKFGDYGDGFIKQINDQFNELESLAVCRGDYNDFLKNENFISTCCEYDSETNKCQFPNRIVVKYNQEAGYYQDFASGSARTMEFFLNNNGTFIKKGGQFTVNKNSELEIIFSDSQESIDQFFTCEENLRDTNYEKIVSVDLSHINTDQFRDLSSFIKDCSNINSFKMSNVYIPNNLVITSAFAGCINLKVFDMSGSYINKMSISDPDSLPFDQVNN